MSSAIAYTYFKAHIVHVDIKSANFVVNADKGLVLIKWEQGGASLYILAPEVDSSWDVKDTIGGAVLDSAYSLISGSLSNED